jgi:hypothetical protein
MTVGIASPRPGRVLARCPRCGGRMLLEADRHGSFLNCLTCGCTLEERIGPPIGEADAERVDWWRAQSA